MIMTKEIKPIDKLRTILCEVEEIRKDIMELRFGCRVTPRNCDYTMYVGHCGYEVSLVNHTKIGTWLVYDVPKDSDLEIIGNNLQERHLRMYCASKRIYVSVVTNPGELTDMYLFDGEDKIELISDNSKDFHNQDDSVIQAIIDFLERE